MSRLNVNSDLPPVKIPVKVDLKPIDPGVSSKLLQDLQSLREKFSNFGQGVAKDLSSAFSSGHDALNKMVQGISEARAKSKLEEERRQAVIELFSGGKEHRKEMAELAAKRAELRGKAFSGVFDVLGKAADFGLKVRSATKPSDGEQGSNEGPSNKITSVLEAAKSGADLGAAALDVGQRFKELRGLAAKASAGGIAAEAAGAGGVGATLTGAASVTGVTALAVGGGLALEEGTVRISRWLGIIEKNSESTAEAFIGWWKASKAAEESTKKVALLEKVRQQKMELASQNEQNVRKIEESRTRSIEANLAVAQVADNQPGVAAAASHSRQAMTEADATLGAGRSGRTDPLGLDRLPSIETNDTQKTLLYAAAAAQRQRIIDADSLAKRAQAQTDVRTFEPPVQGWGSRFHEATKAGHATLHSLVIATAGQAYAPDPTKIVSGGSIPQVGAYIARYEQLEKLQSQITGGAEREFHLLAQRRDLLTQMVGSGAQLLQQAKDQVAAAQNARNARMAQISKLSKAQQTEVADIYERIKKGNASRADYLKIDQMGLGSGRIGRTVNENLAKGVDARLATLFNELGGNEDLDEAVKREKEISDALVKTKTTLNETLVKVEESYQNWLKAQTAQSVTAQQIETLKSQKEGFSEDTRNVAFKMSEALANVVDNALVPAICEAINGAAAKLNNSR